MLTGTAIAEAEALLALYRKHRLTIVTAESCTGGLVAGVITAIPGSSTVFERGFVTYSNEAKADSLGIPLDFIERYGAVSQEVARAMAVGALDNSRADVAIAVTGIAGPGGGTAEKPVGLVHFACARRDGGAQAVERRYGALSRSEIRTASVSMALKMLRDVAG
ncbi:CinA family protein [Beijerinckia sp. L45]|uniref:CinA family protein n=1 Tax=Beijerinckia sp. L45 TaxID=1641855 RepID=UPI00131C3BA1|nr:CinA family protein [Beijerinckia sp. L45]